MQIKFPNTEEEDEIERIKKSVDCSILIPENTLDNFLFQLRNIDVSLCKKQYHKGCSEIEQKRDLVKKLSNRCEMLKQRNTVIKICEDAEDISNSSPSLSDDEIKQATNDISTRIELFIEDNRPSKNSMKFLRFAKKLLEKAKLHQKVLSFPEKKDNSIPLKDEPSTEITLEEFSLAESLYELASILYEKEIEKFLEYKEKNFSIMSQKEIVFHVRNGEGCLEDINLNESFYPIIQGILGYAHTITDYFAGDSPYPSNKEIDNLFSSHIY